MQRNEWFSGLSTQVFKEGKTLGRKEETSRRRNIDSVRDQVRGRRKILPPKEKVYHEIRLRKNSMNLKG